ncbi:alpha/beta fold hydrolase [Paenibacillus cellulositrophicus]|uniref:alpha/beta fold hydrolase n=1 Tax=Paenibacillus cellulositrophicus TaxID=562959 RepID=UPI002040B88F|nr:alpha/beta hydrolase [Paenibacillus cellulositrophicus]MCM2996269.1 alpha/beta fold hydrolase [Paenibacillus cellulositrophicus]
MTEQLIKVDGIELCTESFGRKEDPAILLIMGATASMIWWEDEFCQRLADAGRFVIRYDNRDVGQSMNDEPGNPQYGLEDMADDAIRVLDAYRISRAHVAGMSLGGLLTLMATVKYPERVLSDTLIMTSSFRDPSLPEMEEKVAAFFASADQVNWESEQEVLNFSVQKWNLLRGSKHAPDEDKVRRLAARELQRTRNWTASMFNHGLLTGGEELIARVPDIRVPALVIHGTEDPIIPHVHGEALAREIPGARLLTLEGTGHELHEDDWDAILEAIIQHTADIQQSESRSVK